MNPTPPPGLYAPLAGLAISLAAVPAFAADFVVSSAAQIDAIMNSVSPGDTITMTDGLWTNQLVRLRTNGTPANPVTLRAQTPGQVILNGTSRLEIGGDHLVVEGLRFESGALTTGHVIRFQSSSVDATNSVLRDTAIISYNPPSIDTRYFWVSLYGTDNTVENCRFENHNHSGVTVVVWGDWPNRHTIRNNHFVDRPEGNANGWETIRIGTSEVTDLSSQTHVEANLFERTDGEIEIISDKTADNQHRYNTFKECAATLTLRHATNAVVEGNFFLGEGLARSGGVRVIGPGHLIYNNYFEAIGDRTGGVIALEAGEPNAPDNGYEPVSNATIAHNTFVDCLAPAFDLDRSFGSDGRTIRPTNNTIAANLISLPGETAAIGTDGGNTWSSNLAFAAGLGSAPAPGTTSLATDPLVPQPAGIQRPLAGGPADDATAAAFPFLTEDLEGQPRDTQPDIGADEITALTGPRGPLAPQDVGPTWWDHGGDPPVGVDPDLSAVIEAEHADTITDPDNDGDVFTIVSDQDASAGEAIEAPAGSRTDLGSDPQETVAVYTVAFPAAGTYTAYYRAAGFSGSSDSFYTPANFATDPSVNEATSNNGLYRWEEGGTFTVPAPTLQQEFRISRREGGTRIDTIVFYPEGGLSSEELDFLAQEANRPPCEADLDGDGQLTIFDTLEFLSLYDAQDPAADLNPGGGFNSFDVTLHLLRMEAGCP